MVSRKKSKGKGRKAKKLEAERAIIHERWWKYIAREKKIPNRESISCNHEGVIPKDLDHPVSRFMDEFVTLDNFSLENLKYACQSKPGKIVLNNESYKEMVTQIMIRIGINMLLLDDETETSGALIMAKSICVLEHFHTVDYSIEASMYSREVATKLRDIQPISSMSTISGRRDGLKFFSKRVSCLYLKEMHQEARRTIPKMGMCFGCRKEKERVTLSVCGRCMVMQYCSKECQISHWSRHKTDCGRFV